MLRYSTFLVVQRPNPRPISNNKNSLNDLRNHNKKSILIKNIESNIQSKLFRNVLNLKRGKTEVLKHGKIIRAIFLFVL